MLPWVELGTATVPGDGARLRLMQRGTEFCIFAGTNPLMNSRMSGSEQDLATLSWDRIKPRRGAHVLIGGLGMGFTLRAALAAMPSDVRITVVELVPEIVGWARGPLACSRCGRPTRTRSSPAGSAMQDLRPRLCGCERAMAAAAPGTPSGLRRAASC